ncbi:MAG: beta-glucuronidase [Bacteroidota bacterium]
MLYPQRNPYRESIDLNGLWSFQPDPEDVGEQKDWFKGFPSGIEIAVPGSWNEQLEEIGLMNYIGAAWYSKSVFIPADAAGRTILLRVGSADYHADIWVNGKKAGENHFAFLPFEIPLNDFVTPGEIASIIIRVDNRLTNDTVPQGISSELYETENRLREETFPPARFDFTPFGGIHRPVQLVILPAGYIDSIKLSTSLKASVGIVSISVATKNLADGDVVTVLVGVNDTVTNTSALKRGSAQMQLWVPECRCWSPKDPYLYSFTVQLQSNGTVIDEYSMPVGIREVTIENGELLLNGNKIYLQGFGKHEDSSVNGKGLSLPMMVKDFSLMRWINANSFRTSHYPYAEEMMAMADRMGFLVIDEVPAVSLDFRHTNEKTLAHHKEYFRRLFERDNNHPSVIMWALGNEPNLAGDPNYTNGPGPQYWKQIFDSARSLDSTRPLVVPNCLRAGIDDPVMALSDIICINRYYGWYEYPGRLEKGIEMLEREMDAIHRRYGKPMMMTEFGADTMPGLHSTSDQMFTEEYQEKLLTSYIRLLRSKPYVVGEHVWNFADFKTPQNMRRVVLNLKGVFTRTRSPKMAAFALKKIWAQEGTV